MIDKPIISFPPQDEEKRFLLGKEGENSLLVVCLNPSTADITSLDPTTRNVETIAVNHGYNGWLLFNLSAQRSTKPWRMHNNAVDQFHQENIERLITLLHSNEYGIQNVLFAWGNNIELRSYLLSNAIDIIRICEEFGLSPLKIEDTNKGHPYHPMPTPINIHLGGIENIRLAEFHVNQYLQQLLK